MDFYNKIIILNSFEIFGVYNLYVKFFYFYKISNSLINIIENLINYLIKNIRNII